MGKCLAHIKFDRLVDRTFAVRSGVRNSAILKRYLTLLCQGKSDFDAIGGFRGDAFFARVLRLEMTPSSPTLRQRLDTHALAWFGLTSTINETLLASRIGGRSICFGALACGYTPLDVGTFAMNNGNTKKELVGRTCVGVDGYCPMAASYLGTSGFCLELALRTPGVQHSARESEYDLQRVLPMATRLASGPILVRADSGFCSQTLMHAIVQEGKALGRQLDFLIKWNPHSAPVERIAAQKIADEATLWCHPREGKRLCVWGKLVQVEGMDTPIRHQAQRWRIKTVMQEMIRKAARMMRHAGRWVPGLGANDSGFAVFERHCRCPASG